MTICKVNGMHCDCPPAEPGTVQWCSKCGEGVAHGVCRKPKPAEQLCEDEDGPESCHFCAGTGEGQTEYSSCPRCKGRGWVITEQREEP